MKKYITTFWWVALILFLLSIPASMMIGKVQVCKNYFPELTQYVCWFTNLPPYTGIKK